MKDDSILSHFYLLFLLPVRFLLGCSCRRLLMLWFFVVLFRQKSVLQPRSREAIFGEVALKIRRGGNDVRETKQKNEM